MSDTTKTDQKSKLPTVPWNPWLGVLFVIVVYYASEIFGGLILSIYPGLQHWSHSQAMDWLTNSVIAQFFYLALASGGILTALYFFLKRYGCTFKTIGLKRPRWSDPLYGLMAVPVYYLLYLISVSLVTHFIPSFNVNEQQQVGFNNVHGFIPLALAFISLVILPPITEETMVRGFLYGSLKKGMAIIPAAIATSLIFAAAHLPEGGAAGPLYIAALDTFILSLVLVYLREKTGSLWSSITLHAIKNGIAFVALFVVHAR